MRLRAVDVKFWECYSGQSPPVLRNIQSAGDTTRGSTQNSKKIVCSFPAEQINEFQNKQRFTSATLKGWVCNRDMLRFL
jgi:hypothetical protein